MNNKICILSFHEGLAEILVWTLCLRGSPRQRRVKRRKAVPEMQAKRRSAGSSNEGCLVSSRSTTGEFDARVREIGPASAPSVGGMRHEPRTDSAGEERG